MRGSYPWESPPRRGGRRTIVEAGETVSLGPQIPVESTHQSHEPALYRHAVGPEDSSFISGISGLQRDRIALAAKTLQRDLVAIDQRNDDGAVFGGFASFNDHRVAIHDPGINHRITVHLQRVVLPSA